MTKVNRAPDICECGSHGFAVLTQWGTALFSPTDLGTVEGHTWCIAIRRKQTYAGTNINRKFVYMHSVLAKAKGQHVDHRNGNGLDNRDGNLRPCTVGQNLQNRNCRPASGFKGVYKIYGDRFQARICVGAKHHYLGSFDDACDAARAYDAAAVRLHGEFAKTNLELGFLTPP